MGVMDRWWNRMLASWLLLAAPESNAADLHSRFVRVSHLEVRLPRAGRVEVTVDPVGRQVAVEMPALTRRNLRKLTLQIEAGGGQLIGKRRKRGRTTITMAFPFANLQAVHSVRLRPPRLVMDVGVGRILLPRRPWASLGRRLTPKDPDRQHLIAAEQRLFAGEATAGDAELERIALKSSPAGILACIRSADGAAVAGRFVEASLMAEACLNRAATITSPVEPLAKLRQIAYSGRLFVVDLDRQLAEYLPETSRQDWLAEEFRFQHLRLRHARSEVDRVQQQAIELMRNHPDAACLAETKALAMDSIQRLSESEIRAGRYASLAATLLDALQWIRPLSADERMQVVSLAAQALMKAGGARLAVDLLTWQLKSQTGEKADDRILELLVGSFLSLGDWYRAGRTLDFLVAQRPSKTRRVELLALRGRVHVLAGRIAQAVESMRAVILAAGDRELILDCALRAGLLLQKRKQPRRALQLVSMALQRARRLASSGGTTEADLLSLQADLAYELKQTGPATAAYRAFLERYPEDARAPAAHYRLARLGQRPPSVGALRTKDAHDLWRRAEAMLGKIRAIEEEKR